MRKHLAPLAAVALVAGGLVPATATTAEATARPVVYKNCQALNAKYVHGVRTSARTVDKKRNGTRIASKAVVNAQLYAANKRLDADRDGIACEK